MRAAYVDHVGAGFAYSSANRLNGVNDNSR
jgi:hypothetical protein